MCRASHRQEENFATDFTEVEAKAQPFTNVVNSVPEKSPGPTALIKYFGTQRIEVAKCNARKQSHG